MDREKTISQEVTLTGTDLFYGRYSRVRLIPKNSGGITFYQGRHKFPVELKYAKHKKSFKTRWASCIALDNGYSELRKVEHIITYLKESGIDNLDAIFQHKSVPRMPHGAKEVFEALDSKIVECDNQKVEHSLKSTFEHSAKRTHKCRSDYFIARPAKEGEGVNLSYFVDYSGYRSVGKQYFKFDFNNPQTRKLMHARGIFFLPLGSQRLVKWTSFLHGINTHNAMYVGKKSEKQFRNVNGFGNLEFVLHKGIDAKCLIGLSGINFKDVHFIYNKTGHKFDLQAWNKLIQSGLIQRVDS